MPMEGEREKKFLRETMSYDSCASESCGITDRCCVVQVKKYTTDHEWIELDADGKIGTIGITNYASKALGDVVYVELPELDLDVSKGDSIGAVESVKSASDIMTPVSGKIVEANDVLQEKPATINKGPEGEGWLAKIEVSNSSELDELMTAEEYEEMSKD